MTNHHFKIINLFIESVSRAKESESASDSKETSKDIEKPAKEPEIEPPTVSKNSSEANTSEEEDKMETD